MERNILATLTRGSNSTVKWTRRYASLSNAVRRATELSLFDGEPLDVIQFSSAKTGMELGTVKLHVDSVMTITWSDSTIKMQKIVDSIKGEGK